VPPPLLVVWLVGNKQNKHLGGIAFQISSTKPPRDLVQIHAGFENPFRGISDDASLPTYRGLMTSTRQNTASLHLSLITHRHDSLAHASRSTPVLSSVLYLVRAPLACLVEATATVITPSRSTTAGHSPGQHLVHVPTPPLPPVLALDIRLRLWNIGVDSRIHGTMGSTVARQHAWQRRREAAVLTAYCTQRTKSCTSPQPSPKHWPSHQHFMFNT